MENLNLSNEVIEKLKEKKITSPTDVQKKVIPEILSKKNILFKSDTGTGKTLAFLLPLYENYKSENDACILIISPTHELASQIKNEATFLSDKKAALCFGGSPIKRQCDALKEKPFFIVGSASRLNELINLKKIKIEKIRAVVFDEVDRLLSKELIEDTIEVLKTISQKRISNLQIIACSATLKTDTDKFLAKAIDKNIDTDFEYINMPHENILTDKIQHIAIFSERRDKSDVLRSFICAANPEKALVFTSRPADVEYYASRLSYKKIECECLHAKSDKAKRKSAIDRFKSGKCKILITSDLSSRGLDIQGITHIIQMDLPSKTDFFIHRVGRTARAGNTGTNVVIGDAWEMTEYSKLEKKLKIKVYPCELRGGKLIYLKDI